VSELLPCPFCGAQPTIRTNRDWHHLQADHDDGCPMGERVVSFPATDDDRVALVQTWNRRVRPAPPSAPGLAVARERWFKDWAERGLAPLGLAHGMAFDAGWDAALRAAEEDAARLDWLEAEGMWSEDAMWNLDMRDLCYGFDTLRAAIDAARKEEGDA
jgi:hypothetical protein